ncbi:MULTISPECIES: DUF6436 domain-containing protein [Colwellia]|uniref:DUF6436 domain-containing protein n=1 Tax=Colwellia marinimaniae TaxID=1513592 RepID=A0ABQ0MX61_9GAMM|nr:MULTISPECIES: DUF6436 domain-containing protein [Colwellia]GAW96869.1 hypothetical protein MTCD1_02492 [Colwellia marinimaniae]
MPDLNNNLTKFQFTIIIIWLSFTVAAFYYFVMNKLVSFDVDNKLLGIGHQQLATLLTPYIAPGRQGVGNTVLHFSQPNCDCQQYSKAHIQDINLIASDNEFTIIKVVIHEHKIIPATPSVAIFDAQGDIIYFGPYGQGLACSQTSGYAQTMLNNLIKGYKAHIIIKEAKGCYCSV